jgi:hypothetical protein
MEHREAWWTGRATVIACALLGVAAACTTEQDDAVVCAGYACVNLATLEGEVALPADTEVVKVEYCSEVDCVRTDGEFVLAELTSEPRCAGPVYMTPSEAVCLSLGTGGRVRVTARLPLPEVEELPPYGERYTLTITDVESAETLLEEVREADYMTTREDNCHLCWGAAMSL